MHVDFLIVGQGISGTWLSYFLKKEGKSFLVFDQAINSSASSVSAGLINPVTGRRRATVWMADEILPFAEQQYKELGIELQIQGFAHRSLIDFFPNPDMRISFLKRAEERNPYVHSFPEQNQFNKWFNYAFGCGEIRPVYIAHLDLVLPAWRKKLISDGKLREEKLDPAELLVKNDSIQYRDITANRVIFCDGIAGAQTRYFDLLPFALNKGEALWVEIPGLPATHVYKSSHLLIPMSDPDLYWVGSNYVWDFENAWPTREFRLQTEYWLREFLKMPFTVRDHQAAIRPATIERRPFVGMHPHYPSVGILNGMGTKGCSLAPYFAKQLVDHLLYGNEIAPEASIGRYHKILARDLS